MKLFSLSTSPPWRTLAIALAVALPATYAWRHARADAGAAPPPAPAAQRTHDAAQQFSLSEAQWATLKIAPASAARFDAVLTADGLLAADDQFTVPVFSPYSGRVLGVAVQAGDTVRQGATLMTLAATELAQGRSDLAAAAATEATARRQWLQAQATEQRQRELLKAEAAAQKDWQQSATDLAAAENAYHAAQAATRAARDKLSALGDGAASAGGQAVVAAPIAGVVLQRQVAPGQFVSSLVAGGGNPLFTLSDLRHLWVLASVPEADAARLRKGQALDIVPLATPERHLGARIAWIAATVDPATHRVAVRANLPNPDGQWRPQMSVTVRVLDERAGQRQPAIAVPRGAVMYDGAQALCYVVAGERSLSPRRIAIGRAEGGLVEVTQGLRAGDRVVTQGTLFIDRAAEDAAS